MRSQRPWTVSFLVIQWGALVTMLVRGGLAQKSCSVTKETVINALPTQTKSGHPIPACTTFAGSMLLQDVQEANFDGYEVINGDLRITKDSGEKDSSVHSDTLRDINGTLLLGPKLSSTLLGDIDVSFPALEHLTELRVDAPFDDVTLSFGPNLTVGAVRMANLRKGNPLFLNVTTITGIDKISTEDQIVNNEAGSFYSPLVLLNTTLLVAWNLFTSIEFPNAETLHTMWIHGNSELEAVSIAARSAAALDFADNGRTTSVRLPRLANLTGRMFSTGTRLRSVFANLVDVQLPALREVGNETYSLKFHDNLFAELDLSRLERANTTVEVDDNPVLSDLLLPRLSVVGDLVVRDNPRLLNLTANSLRWAEKVNLRGNFTNVELFALKEVPGDFSVIGAPSMDCSWFDDNLFQKVVQGSYLCEGNHTRPAVPRTPSTPPVTEDPPAVDGDGEKTDDSHEGEQVDGSGGGLSTGAKAGIGAGAGLGGLIVVVGCFFFFWKNKKKDKGASAGSGGMGEEAGGLPEADGNALPPPLFPVKAELDDTKHLAEATSKAWEANELDSSPREQAGTREEFDDTSVRAELPPGTVKGHGIPELPA